MKKILISIMIIAVVAAIAIGGTVAYFATTSNPVDVSIATATPGLGATINGDVAWAVTGVVPGWQDDKIVTVGNTSGIPMYITPVLINNGSELDDALTMSIGAVTGATYVSPGVYLIADGAQAQVQIHLAFPNLAVDQTQYAGKTANYRLTFKGAQSAADLVLYLAL